MVSSRKGVLREPRSMFSKPKSSISRLFTATERGVARKPSNADDRSICLISHLILVSCFLLSAFKLFQLLEGKREKARESKRDAEALVFRQSSWLFVFPRSTHKACNSAVRGWLCRPFWPWKDVAMRATRDFVESGQLLDQA